MGRKNERIADLERRVSELEMKLVQMAANQLYEKTKDNPIPPVPNWPDSPWAEVTRCGVCGKDMSLLGPACYRSDCPNNYMLPSGPTWTRD